MHYPHMVKEYEDAIQKMAQAIQLARAGKYREGYLGLLIDGLEMMGEASKTVGRWPRDGQMIDQLVAEFRAAMADQDKEPGPSPLSELFQAQGGEHQPEQHAEHHAEHREGYDHPEGQHQENPGQAHGTMRRQVGR